MLTQRSSLQDAEVSGWTRRTSPRPTWLIEWHGLAILEVCLPGEGSHAFTLLGRTGKKGRRCSPCRTSGCSSTGCALTCRRREWRSTRTRRCARKWSVGTQPGRARSSRRRAELPQPLLSRVAVSAGFAIMRNRPDQPLRRQDSNLDHRNQNPRCCHYTTADRPLMVP